MLGGGGDGVGNHFVLVCLMKSWVPVPYKW